MKKKVLITFTIGALIPAGLLSLFYIESSVFLNLMLGLIFILFSLMTGTFAVSIVLGINIDDMPSKIKELFFKKGKNKNE